MGILCGEICLLHLRPDVFPCKLNWHASRASNTDSPQETTRNLAPIISAQGLSKRYGVAPLFQNISFTVSEGDRIGLIGPNGSGKSTLLAILDGRVKPDSGRGGGAQRDAAELRRAGVGVCAGRDDSFGDRRRARPHRRGARGSRRAAGGNAGPRRIRGFRDSHRYAVGRVAQAPGDCRSAGAASGHSAARRADQPSRPCGDQVGGGPAAERGVCLRGGEPRPLFPGKRRERNRGAEPRLL